MSARPRRVLRMMSVVTSLIQRFLQRWSKAGNDKHAPSNIGSKLTDATTMQARGWAAPGHPEAINGCTLDARAACCSAVIGGCSG